MEPISTEQAKFERQKYGRATILIIYGNMAERERLKKSLEHEQYLVREFEYEGNITRLIDEISPDLIFLDYQKEQMAQFPILGHLKKEEDSRRYTPVILISEVEDILAKLKVFEAKGDDLIFTPLRISNILCRMDLLLSLRSLIDLLHRNEQLFNELGACKDARERIHWQKTRIFEYFRQSTAFLSDHKLSLHYDRDELDDLSEADIIIQHNVFSKDDLRGVKELLHFHTKDLAPRKDEWNRIIISVSEALSNIIKYARYGKVTAGKSKDFFLIRIDDEGPGIPYMDLLRAIFIKKFPRERIHQLGVPLIMELVDHISLHTGEQGTSMLLHFKL